MSTEPDRNGFVDTRSFSLHEDLYRKASRRTGFDYDTLKAAIDKGGKVLARVGLPETPQCPGSMARSVEELLRGTER